MSRIKKIAIDIDDTLTETLSGIRATAKKRSGVDLPLEAYKTPGDYWGYYERVWADHGLKGKLVASDIYEEIHRDQTLTPLLPGAEFAVQQLLKKNEVVLITSRDQKWENHTKEWLSEQFGDMAPEVYFCKSHKDKLAKTKGQIAKDLGVDLLIDDNVGHCQTALDSGLEAILFGNYGWHTTAPEGLVRCVDWQSVLDYIEGLS